MLLAACFGAAAALGGCGGIDGVELQGGVFDALGISGNALAGKGKEPQVPIRSGIVLPPQPDRLPQPGAAAPPDVTQALPEDEDQRKVRAAADSERQHKEFCEKALREARVRGEEGVIVQGPRGQCNPSILSTMGQSLNNLNQPPGAR